jgi:hypothetical protein
MTVSPSDTRAIVTPTSSTTIGDKLVSSVVRPGGNVTNGATGNREGEIVGLMSGSAGYWHTH